jgi:RimJ/RimL family protein N-acetyltransferase
MQVRPIEESDAERFLHLLCQLDAESKNMLFEPGERPVDLARQRERIRAMAGASPERVLVADAGERLVGFLGVRAGEFARNRHVASLVVGVLQAAQRRGVGTGLLAAALAWADARGAARVELTVRTDNHPAVALYLRQGFVVEGLRRASLRVDGRLVDEYHMARVALEAR